MKQDKIFSQRVARAISIRSFSRISRNTTGLVLLLLLFLTSCSTTSKLPSDEQLYIGIDKISYTNTPTKKSKIRLDSVGVITTILSSWGCGSIMASLMPSLVWENGFINALLSSRSMSQRLILICVSRWHKTLFRIMGTSVAK